MRAIAPEAAARPRQRAAYFLRCLGEAHAAARALPSGWDGVLCVSVRHAAYLQTYDIDVEEVISQSSRRLPPASTLYSKKMASTSAMKSNLPKCSSIIASKPASVVACASVQSPICCKRSYRMRIMSMVCKVRGRCEGTPKGFTQLTGRNGGLTELVLVPWPPWCIRTDATASTASSPTRAARS